MRKMNFHMLKTETMEKLQGNWFMFGLCLFLSTMVFMFLLPEKYIYSFVQPGISLSVSEHFRMFVATAVSESLVFTFTAAMYRVIFIKKEEEKGGTGLLLKNANLVFPSSIVPILLTKVSLSFLSFITTPAVSDFFYDYLFFTAINYAIYSWILLVLSLVVSVLSLYVNFAFILTPCIIADNPEISGREAMKISRIYMGNKKMNMFLFMMSFIPAYLLGMFGFGIGMMWAHAYMLTGVYIYYNKIKTA